MSSLRPVGRSAAASSNDRKSLCRFTFADGRQCRSPRSPGHPHLCPDHARKASQSRGADKLARELSYFFSGEYLSACDLSAALGRLIAAVARGEIKPRAARTLAYLSQTLVQTIHLAEQEYINARGTDSWRKAVHNSVRQNYDYRNPSPSPDPPAPSQPADPPSRCHSERSASSASRTGSRGEESAVSESRSASSKTASVSQPAPSPRSPMPPTSSEFAEHVLADQNLSRRPRPCPESDPETGDGHAPQPQTRASTLAVANTPPVAHPFRGEAIRSVSQPLEPLSNFLAEHGNQRPARDASPASSRQESAFSESQSDPSPTTPTAQPANPSRTTGPCTPQPVPTRDASALHFDHNCRLLVDGKPI